jgi:hypothetical protein
MTPVLERLVVLTASAGSSVLGLFDLVELEIFELDLKMVIRK